MPSDTDATTAAPTHRQAAPGEVVLGWTGRLGRAGGVSTRGARRSTGSAASSSVAGMSSAAGEADPFVAFGAGGAKIPISRCGSGGATTRAGGVRITSTKAGGEVNT